MAPLLIQLLTAISVLSNTARGVDIRFYLGGSQAEDCLSRPTMEFPNHPQGICAKPPVPRNPPFYGRAVGVLFTGLETGMGNGLPAAGIAFNYDFHRNNNEQGCHEACDGVLGGTDCLNCNDEGVYLTGAAWYQCQHHPTPPTPPPNTCPAGSGKSKEVAEIMSNPQLNCSVPAYFQYKGHYFHMENGTPRSTRNAMIDLWESGSDIKYKDLPANILAVEDFDYMPE